MTTVQDANALLMGSGGRSAKFENVGDVIVGDIMRVETRQMTEIGTGKLLAWPDGNPKMQLVFQLLVDEQEDEEDDGLRNLYCPIPSAMSKAIAEAVRKTGEHGFAVGGKLGVKFVRVEAPKTRGFNGQKIYTASYKAPEVSLAGMDEPVEHEDLPF